MALIDHRALPVRRRRCWHSATPTCYRAWCSTNPAPDNLRRRRARRRRRSRSPNSARRRGERRGNGEGRSPRRAERFLRSVRRRHDLRGTRARPARPPATQGRHPVPHRDRALRRIATHPRPARVDARPPRLNGDERAWPDCHPPSAGPATQGFLCVCQAAGSEVVGWGPAGPGSDLSEELVVGVEPAALDVRVAPGCPPGPAARAFSARRRS